ncbi:class I SAM-dependent methyltransferase [Kovacikia minuta CCNUW1]|uniref:class I SAM-dependent methyltransferase n=1 Tax=Kovacikia minuta TaxID=2931930 RepID=UPI001CD01783|nr:class I SAM-dependent methyltransferase [Kovacikia minuta]UBF27345.1 class I SAM-dependent methyltransferase [Kovacikia minuta CCNUW1]
MHLAFLLKKVVERYQHLILGRHPNNTIFSFNYHNVRHINRFLWATRNQLPGNALTLVDVGAGKSPYYPIFAELVEDYIAIDSIESLPQNEVRPIKQMVGFAEKLSIPEVSADIILSNAGT